MIQKGYIHKQYIFPDSIEHEYYYRGNYGAKGEKRSPKRARTPEEIKAVNQLNKEKRVRHLIKQNFKTGDYFVTLNFGDDYLGRSLASIRRTEIRNFLARLRRAYKKADIPFKFIIRVEMGARKARPHIHIIMNRIPDLDRIINEQWTYGKGANIEPLTDDPETALKLAGYITKQPTAEEQNKIDAFCGGDISKMMYYSCSRNLERPVPKQRAIRSRTMHSIFNHDLVPVKGFYIDKNEKTFRSGVNPYTGLSYLYYQEIRLRTKETAPPVRLCECPICHQLTFEGLTCNCQEKRKRVPGKHIHPRKYKSSAKERG